MKKIYSRSLSIVTLLLLFAVHFSANAQAYRKGSFLISISEGSTLANYSTKDISGKTPVLIHRECLPGVRDPLMIEYAVANRWGIGLSSGTDVFNVNPSSYYGFSTSNNQVKVSTSEFTFDINYHVFVNKRLDLSVFASTGLFSIAIKGHDNDNYYNHSSNGTIVRYGTRARYYFWKRLGAIGMISSYIANCSPKEVKGNTEAKSYSTSINGMAIEMGLCYRLLR
ncbi:MAG: hypothetical protein HY062_07725 [Bacteroidetes bacterium]|nr:hypothetical protein [Bacteroidota bacterium]